MAIRKILQVPFCFYPDPVGGTEVYVESLAQRLRQRGFEPVIAAPGKKDERYSIHGLTVWRYWVSSEAIDLRDLYGEGDERAAASFGKILDSERPDVIHLHAFTFGVSLRMVREAKKRKIPVLFTYHTPTVSCQRGTLMKWGREVCDGRLDVSLCSRCTLQGLGLPRPFADLLGALPPAAGTFLARAGLKGKTGTAVRMSELIAKRHESFRLLMLEVDCVIAVSQWVENLLILNGIPKDKIILCRQGIEERSHSEVSLMNDSLKSKGQDLKLIFLGRLHPTKGIDLLIRAITSLPNLKVYLDIYGIAQENFKDSYVEKLRNLAGQDPRIRFLKPVAPDEVRELLKKYHALAVPSRWLESGPLVVLEAFEAGIPVIGSDLGGIAELVRHGVDGILVPSVSVKAWRAALENFSQGKPRSLKELARAIRPQRTVGDVAEDMIRAYQML